MNNLIEDEYTNIPYEYSYVKTSIVARNINEYVIPECQEACKSFWDKNIMTFMCSNYSDSKESTYVLMNGLSDENKEILERLLQEDPEHYYFSSYRNAYGIRADGTKKSIADDLKKLTEPFKMQDIQEGIMTPEDFLKNKVGLVIHIINPEYEKFEQEHPGPKMSDFSNLSEYLNAQEEYEKRQPRRILAILDTESMDKTFEEYLQEYGYSELYDAERNIIYEDEFYKEGHERYINYIKQNENRKAISGSELFELAEGERKETVATTRKGLITRIDIEKDADIKSKEE